MKLSLICLFGIATLFACNNIKSAKTETASTITKDSTKTDTALPNSFYKRLEGSIAGKSVVVQLQKENGILFGDYYYNGPWLRLTNYHATRKDSINLLESSFYDYYFNQNAKQAHLTLGWTGSGFNGTWLNGDSTKSYPIKLEEKYPEGSFKFKMGAYNDSVVALPNKANSPKAEISFAYLQPQADDDLEIWLDEKLKTISGIKQPNVDRGTGIKNLAEDYFKVYKAEVKKQQHGRDTAFLKFMNYYSHDRQSVAFNDKGYVVLESLNETYTGGAHGNYASTMYCLDVKNKKQLALSDIVKIDTNTLQTILEKNFRELYNIKPNGDLKKVLFDNSIKPNKNFYFNQYGLAFMYNPYEVASYAQGQVVVFIPFTDLKQYLTQGFKSRMGL